MKYVRFNAVVLPMSSPQHASRRKELAESMNSELETYESKDQDMIG